MLKIFISYSWDGKTHQDWVKKLADDLERYKEFNVVFDQYDLDMRIDKNYFMEKGVFDSDVILIVCTESYAIKANTRSGGVGIETFMTTIKHWEDNEKRGSSNIIAITREDRLLSIPNYLKGKISIDFSNDEKYLESFNSLKSNLQLFSPKNKRPKKTKTLKTEKEKFFEFNRVDDILAINYKNREKIDFSKDFSSKNKIKYEFWQIQPLEKSYILVLFENINIKQTIERFIKNNNKFIPKKITLLRVTKGEAGYIEKIFSEYDYNISITEYTIDDFVWNFCIDQEWKNENKVQEEEFFIDQKIYHELENGEEENLDLSINYIEKSFLKEDNIMPIMMLFAPGGMGKSTLSQVLTNRINNGKEKHSILIQSEYIRENINKDVSKNYEIYSVYQLYDIYMRLTSDNKSLLHEKEFELGVLSGKFILIIDGLDEIISLFRENFHLDDFIESLNLLNKQLGKSKIVITSRINILDNNPQLKENLNIDLVFLKGFEEDIWKKYIKQRFLKYTESDNYLRKAEKYLYAIIDKDSNDDKKILPFYLDLICEIVEDENINSSTSFVVDTISDDYESNAENIDYLIHAILKREIVRQEFNEPISKLINLFKELAIEYGDKFSKENLRELIQYYFDASDEEEIFQKILLNPLLKTNVLNDFLYFKYDFLSNYFITLRLIDLILCVGDFEIDKSLIKQLDKNFDGSHVLMHELVKYFKNKQNICMKSSKIIIQKVVNKIKKDDLKIIMLKHVISAILYLNMKIQGENLSKDKRRTILLELYNDTKIEHLYIWGEFYAIDFSNLEIWSSEFHAYQKLCSSKFVNTKFYHSLFDNISHNDDCKSITKNNFDYDSCTLGNLAILLEAKETKIKAQFKILEEDLIKFFRNFFNRGNFVYKDLNNITIPNRLASKSKSLIDFLLDKDILEQEPVVLKKSYGIKATYQKDIQSLHSNNHMTPKLKSIVEQLI